MSYSVSHTSHVLFSSSSSPSPSPLSFSSSPKLKSSQHRHETPKATSSHRNPTFLPWLKCSRFLSHVSSADYASVYPAINVYTTTEESSRSEPSFCLTFARKTQTFEVAQEWHGLPTGVKLDPSPLTNQSDLHNSVLRQVSILNNTH